LNPRFAHLSLESSIVGRLAEATFSSSAGQRPALQFDSREKFTYFKQALSAHPPINSISNQAHPMSKDRSVIISIFGVKEEDWDRFQEIMDDSGSNYDTWKEWKKGADKMVKKSNKNHTDHKIVYANLDDFQIWCLANNKPKVSESRSEYVLSLDS
jgi:hypothetical protein